MKKALENVVLYQMDGQANSELKNSYGVKGFPVFILSDASGKNTEKWKGYSGPDNFIETLGDKLDAVKAD